ncbi:aldehyde dehydrogenase family protein [Streptomyces californicus]
MSFFRELAHQYIDGEWLTGSGSWDIIDFNPYNGEKLAAVTVATALEVDRAYRAAERAQQKWAAINPYERRAVLERALDITLERADAIAEAITDELGGTRSRSRYEIEAAAEFLREAVRQALRPSGRLLPAVGDGRENRLYRLPVGVVGIISAFNFPFLVAMKSVAPALALGNAVVLKPHQNAPVVGGGLIAKIFEDAGLPAGLLNMVITDSAEIGDAFIEHPVPKVISFTGSDRVGRHIAATAAGGFKRTILELSGNSALVVLEDADVEYAVQAAVFSRFLYQGQVGMAANRILLDRSVAAEFTERFTAEVAALKAGDPRDAGDPDRAGHQRLPGRRPGRPGRAGGGGRRDRPRTGPDRGQRGRPDRPHRPRGGLPAADAGDPRAGGPAADVRRRGGGRPDRQRGAVRAQRRGPHAGRGARGEVRAADRQRDVPRQRLHGAGDPQVAFGGEKTSGVGRLNGEAVVEAFATQRWMSIQHGRSVFPF